MIRKTARLVGLALLGGTIAGCDPSPDEQARTEAAAKSPVLFHELRIYDGARVDTRNFDDEQKLIAINGEYIHLEKTLYAAVKADLYAQTGLSLNCATVGKRLLEMLMDRQDKNSQLDLLERRLVALDYAVARSAPSAEKPAEMEKK